MSYGYQIWWEKSPTRVQCITGVKGHSGVSQNQPKVKLLGNSRCKCMSMVQWNKNKHTHTKQTNKQTNKIIGLIQEIFLLSHCQTLGRWGWRVKSNPWNSVLWYNVKNVYMTLELVPHLFAATATALVNRLVWVSFPPKPPPRRLTRQRIRLTATPKALATSFCSETKSLRLAVIDLLFPWS